MSIAQCQNGSSRAIQIFAVAASLVLISVSAARAQQPAAEPNDARPQDQLSVRLSEDSASVAPLTTKARFDLATKRALTPYFYPVIGAVTMFSEPSQAPPVGQSVLGYGPRFATAVADYAIGNFMTTAVAPSIFHQDPRYVAAARDKGFGRRAAYAASRVLVTRGESGHTELNYSRIAGQAGTAGLSTLYNRSADRSVTGQLTSLGMRLMWDAASNELREFWPDIRHAIFRH